MNMLVGTYNLKVKKRKVVIPSKMLSEFSDDVYIGINNEKIIYIINHDQLEEFSTRTDLTKFRFLLSVNINESGVIDIPIKFYEHAYIKDECIIIGVGDHAELWNPVLWKQFTDDFEAHKDEYLKNLNNLVL